MTVELPEQPVYVDGDATRLSQVLQNLLINAAKYTPDGGRIALRLEAADGSVMHLRVSDNGRGIAPGELEQHLRAVHAGRRRLRRPRERTGHRPHAGPLAV